MRSDPEIHHRTFPRSKAYDYSPAGGHFVTLVAFGRQNLFGDVVEGKMRVHALGRIEHECWQDIPLHFPNVEIEKFVVMPDHVHGVIFILENNSARVGAQHDLKESIRLLLQQVCPKASQAVGKLGFFGPEILYLYGIHQKV